jgi:hypothetical protein
MAGYTRAVVTTHKLLTDTFENESSHLLTSSLMYFQILVMFKLQVESKAVHNNGETLFTYISHNSGVQTFNVQEVITSHESVVKILRFLF